VEVVRRDFCAYLEQLRRTLAALQDELPSAKGRDDAEMAMRTLNLFAAEYRYLDRHEAGLARLLEVLEGELEPHPTSTRASRTIFSTAARATASSWRTPGSTAIIAARACSHA
jgi:hypothetical protein